MSPETTRRVTTGYLLALAAGVPFSAWASRCVGPTRLWLSGLALFAGFTIWCALAADMTMLLAVRVCDATGLVVAGIPMRLSHSLP